MCAWATLSRTPCSAWKSSSATSILPVAKQVPAVWKPEHCRQAGNFRTHAKSAPDASTSPFRELGLFDVWSIGATPVRVRQHVNPLRREFQQPAEPPDWHAAYHDSTLPLFLDLGCGPGRFLLLLSRKSKATQNYLGIEIRRALVDRSNSWAKLLGCNDRVHFHYANATLWLRHILGSYPGPLQSVAIQFPDPHFKKRHKKRRIFQPDFVRSLADMLAPGGSVFLQTDVLPVAVAMRDMFEDYAGNVLELAPVHAEGNVFFTEGSSHAQSDNEGGDLESRRHHAANHDEFVEAGSGADGGSDLDGHDAANEDESTQASKGADDGPDDADSFDSKWALRGWLLDNPIGVPTEREHYVMSNGLPVYRVLLVKKHARV